MKMIVQRKIGDITYLLKKEKDNTSFINFAGTKRL
jgi:hypothetical protein